MGTKDIGDVGQELEHKLDNPTIIIDILGFNRRVAQKGVERLPATGVRL